MADGESDGPVVISLFVSPIITEYNQHGQLMANDMTIDKQLAE